MLRIRRVKHLIGRTRHLACVRDTVRYWRIRSMGPWFQSFELPPNVITTSKWPMMATEIVAQMYRNQLKSKGVSLSNATCIDLGAAEGRWSIFLLELGACSVTAVEYRTENVRKMNYLFTSYYKAYRARMRIVQEDVMKHRFDQTYDLAVFSGLLYHLTTDEQMELLKRLSEHAKYVLLGTMIFYPGPFDAQDDVEAFAHPVHQVTKNGLLIDDPETRGVGAASTTKITLWPTTDRLYEMALESDFQIEPIMEPEVFQEMNSYRRNMRVQNGIRVGYHDYWLTGPLARG